MAELATIEQSPIYGELDALCQTPTFLSGFDVVQEAFSRQHDFAPEPIDNIARQPEAEIYGRSLSTIHRLGAFMVGKVAAEVVSSPEAEQARAEFYTSVEEGFGTDMELGGGLEVRDFDTRAVLGGKVMSKDLKTAVSDMTESGLANAEEKVKTEKSRGDYRFVPQLTRSKWDHENALKCDAMARGETDYNTRIVISPFPEEGAAQSGDGYWRDIGYVPHLRRGFVQIYHATDEGLVAGSLSFDGSDKRRLRELFARYNVKVPEFETTDNWLQYAITDTLSEDEAKTLGLEIADQAADPKYKKTANTVDVTSEYHEIMDTVFNESYVHACESLVRGRQTPGVRELVFELANKADSFNARYSKALYEMRADENRFTDDDMIVIHELLVYSTIEMMRALHTGELEDASQKQSTPRGNDGPTAVYLQFEGQTSIQSMLANFGAEGARNNRAYSACGLSISPGDAANSAENPQYAFGGKDAREDSDADCEFTSKECPLCHAKNVKTVVKKVSSTHKRIEGDCGCSTTVKAD